MVLSKSYMQENIYLSKKSKIKEGKRRIHREGQLFAPETAWSRARSQLRWKCFRELRNVSARSLRMPEELIAGWPRRVG